MWYPDPSTGKVVAGVTRVTPVIVAAARSTWGDAVTVVQRDRFSVASKVARMTSAVKVASTSTKPATSAAVTPNLAPFPSRLLDAQPYYGGTEIGVPNFPSAGIITFCTAAFSNALGRMLSAGHCFPINKVVQQGYFDTATATWNFTGNMGKVDWVQWGNNRPDAEELNPSLAGSQSVASRIYNTLTTSVAAVGTVFPHAIGAPFCADGALTGEKCKGVVDASNVCANINDNGTIVTVCNLTSGHSSDGSRLVQHGDSGGPVYVKVTGGVGRSGIISAGNVDSGQPGNHLLFTDLQVVCQTLTQC
jgi:hypothetical protein